MGIENVLLGLIFSILVVLLVLVIAVSIASLFARRRRGNTAWGGGADPGDSAWIPMMDVPDMAETDACSDAASDSGGYDAS